MNLNIKEPSTRDQLLRECRAMARHAFASGLKVSGQMIQTLEMIGEANSGEPYLSYRDGQSTDESDDTLSTTPLTVPPSGQAILQLVQIHGRLADLVAPATPRTILLLSEEAKRGGTWQFLGPVPLIRRMIFMALASLVAMVAISLNKAVNGEAQNYNIFQNHGISLLLNELFLLSAAGIGASFSALFRASRYVQEGTFDPKYESTYWIRFVLGLLAGMMLASLVPLETLTKGAKTGSPSLLLLERPLLALLGGFSAVLVYRILNRLLETVDSLVRGDNKDLVIAQQQTANARAAEHAAEQRMQMLAKVAALRQELNNNPDPQNLKREMDRIQQDLVPTEGIANMATILFAEPSAVANLPEPPRADKVNRKTPKLSEDSQVLRQSSIEQR